MTTATLPPPPPYSLLPPIEDVVKNISNTVSEPQTIAEKIKVNVFASNAREKGSNGQWESWGTLEVGVKNPFGIRYHDVSYRPPDGDLCDISRDIRVYTDEKNPNGPLQYKKLNGTGLTNYSFNIFISDYGSDKAKFNGTMKYAGVEYEWKGFFVTKKEKEVQNPVINIPKPANLDSAATIDGLHSITPFVWKSDDSGNQKSNDQAQNFGDKMMNSIMLHALDDNTRADLLPNLQPLDAMSISILQDNKDYFKRSAIHFLAEQIKKMQGVNPDLTKSIAWRFQPFNDMLGSTEKAQPEEEDPVKLYNKDWDREKNAKEIGLLRSQHLNATMRCYQEGFKLYCPEWHVYLKEPVYWFKYYAAYLQSDPLIEKWEAGLTDRTERVNVLSAAQEVYLWSSKLLMLKFAAPEKEALALNVDEVTEYLSQKAANVTTLKQLINKDMVKKLKELADKMANEEKSKEWKERFEALEPESREIASGLRAEAADIVWKMGDPDSGFCARVRAFQKRRVPPKMPEPQAITMDQILDFLHNADEMQEVQEAMEAIGKPPILKRIKDAAVKVKNSITLKGCLDMTLRGIGIFYLVSSLMEGVMDPGVNMKAAEYGMIACSLFSEGVRAFGWLGKHTFGVLYKNSKFMKGWISWFSNATSTPGAGGWKLGFALGGNVKNFLRTVAWVGCIFAIVNSWNDAHNADHLDPEYREAFKVYSWVQFGLSVAEFIVITLEFGLEMLGMTGAIATVCGPLGIFIGLLAITATIIYYAIFAPKPDDQFKSFLKREAAPVGSWYDGQDLNAEYLAKEAEAKKKYDEMTAKKKEAQKPAT